MTATLPNRTRPGWQTAGALLALLVAVALVVGGCGDPGKSAGGVVIAVDAPAGEVTGFTLRTQEGETLRFVIGELETGGAAFAASHLVEHAVSLEPIAVGYRIVDAQNVAHRLVDAPWAAPAP
jgi:hypothetical protein